jgi:hypothetical protein
LALLKALIELDPGGDRADEGDLLPRAQPGLLEALVEPEAPLGLALENRRAKQSTTRADLQQACEDEAGRCGR